MALVLASPLDDGDGSGRLTIRSEEPFTESPLPLQVGTEA